jgi:hypothetical protein
MFLGQKTAEAAAANRLVVIKQHGKQGIATPWKQPCECQQ